MSEAQNNSIGRRQKVSNDEEDYDYLVVGYGGPDHNAIISETSDADDNEQETQRVDRLSKSSFLRQHNKIMTFFVCIAAILVALMYQDILMALQKIASHYGWKRLDRLGLDRYGPVNVHKMLSLVRKYEGPLSSIGCKELMIIGGNDLASACFDIMKVPQSMCPAVLGPQELVSKMKCPPITPLSNVQNCSNFPALDCSYYRCRMARLPGMVITLLDYGKRQILLLEAGIRGPIKYLSKM